MTARLAGFPIHFLPRRNKCRSSCEVPLLSDFHQNRNMSENCNNLSKIRFHENLFSRFHVVTCGQTDGHADMANRIDVYFIFFRLNTEVRL